MSEMQGETTQVSGRARDGDAARCGCRSAPTGSRRRRRPAGHRAASGATGHVAAGRTRVTIPAMTSRSPRVRVRTVRVSSPPRPGAQPRLRACQGDHHPRRRLADEARRRARDQPGRQVGGVLASPSLPTTTSRSSDLWMVPVDGSGSPRATDELRRGRERARVESRQRADRVHGAARRRRGRADLRARPRAGRRGAARHDDLAPARARPPGAPTGRRSCSRATSTRARGPRRRTRPRRRSARTGSTTRGSTTASRCGTGTAGWTIAGPASSCVAAQPGAEAKDLLAGSALVQRAGLRRAVGERRRGAVGRRGRPTGRPSSSPRRPTGTKRPSPRPCSRSGWCPSSGGEPARLTADGDSYGEPTFSPDGKTLFARMEPATDEGLQRDAARVVGVAAWPARARWSRRASIARSAASRLRPMGAPCSCWPRTPGHEKLFSVAAGGGHVTEVGALEAGCLTNLDVGGDGAPVARRQLGQRREPAGGRPHRRGLRQGHAPDDVQRRRARRRSTGSR